MEGLGRDQVDQVRVGSGRHETRGQQEGAESAARGGWEGDSGAGDAVVSDFGGLPAGWAAAGDAVLWLSV